MREAWGLLPTLCVPVSKITNLHDDEVWTEGVNRVNRKFDVARSVSEKHKPRNNQSTNSK